MREVEFLPDWYVQHRGRADRRRAQARVCAAAAACGLCMSVAVGALHLGHAAAATPSPAATTSDPSDSRDVDRQSPRRLTAQAAGALEALDRLTPPGVCVTHLDLRIDSTTGTPAVVLAEVRGVAEGANAVRNFAAAVRASPSFAAVKVRGGDEAAAGGAAGNSFYFTVQLRLAGHD